MATTTTATAPHNLPRSNDTGLSDSTHSSSSSAERYRLDEFDASPILLYQYRGTLKTSSQKDLCSWLDKEPNLRVTRKPLPRWTSYIDVKRHDLYLPEEKDKYARFPNYDSSLAAIKVPMQAYVGRALWGGYDELYIVSPESSPAASTVSSSPDEAWGRSSWTVGGERELQLEKESVKAGT